MALYRRIPAWLLWETSHRDSYRKLVFQHLLRQMKSTLGTICTYSEKDCPETRWFLKYGHINSLQKSLPSATFNSKNSMTLFLFVVIMKLQSFTCLQVQYVVGFLCICTWITFLILIFIINLYVCMSICTQECMLCVYVCIWLYACHCTCMEVRRQRKCLSLPFTLLETGSFLFVANMSD